LIELLVVIAIITILAALTLAAGEGVMTHAARSRAQSEIQAMASALESYKADNGVYPSAPPNCFANGTNDYVTSDGSSPGIYQTSSEALYQALSSQTNYTDTPIAGAKHYMAFTIKQLGNTKPGSGNTYVQDPFGYAYGFYSGDTNSPPQYPPNNGAGNYDLWSTGGILYTQLQSNPNLKNSWLCNWQ
jgi:type II secretory pathway pseudopilin PulG